MVQGAGALHWSRRLSRQKLRRLYLLDAQGILDEELVEEVGTCLLARCQDILTVHQAKRGKKVRCPVCELKGDAVYIPRQGGFDEMIRCPQCGWQIRWVDYLGATKRRQLNAGGARKAFEGYVTRYENARTPQEKMLAIDRLIHEFHYSFPELPELPTRPVGANLIQGNLRTVIELLNELTFGKEAPEEVIAIRKEWQDELGKFETIDWDVVRSERAARREQAGSNSNGGVQNGNPFET